MLGLLLGTLCEASTLLNPKVAPLIVLGILALAVSGAVGILGGYVVYWFKKGDFNPVVGIAGVSCVPTTAKIAHMLLRMKIRLQSFCLLLWALTSAALSYPLSLAAYSSQPLAWLNN